MSLSNNNFGKDQPASSSNPLTGDNVTSLEYGLDSGGAKAFGIDEFGGIDHFKTDPKAKNRFSSNSPIKSANLFSGDNTSSGYIDMTQYGLEQYGGLRHFAANKSSKFVRASIIKSNNIFSGDNTTGDYIDMTQYGSGQYGGLRHFAARNLKTLSH